MSYPLVLIEWTDAYSEDGWQLVSDVRTNAAEEHALCVRTAGFLIADTDDYVVVANTLSGATSSTDELCGGTMQIPRANIRRRVDLV